MSDVATVAQTLLSKRTAWHRSQFESWRKTLGDSLFNRMISRIPYSIGWFMQVQARWSDKVERIGVSLTYAHTFRCDINREWFGKVSENGQMAAIEHEIKHVSHLHYWRMPKVAKLHDPMWWNAGCDLAINPGIRYIDYCSPIIMPRMFGWPDGLSAEEYHMLLLRRGETMEQQQEGGRQFWLDTSIPVYETRRGGRRIPVNQFKGGHRSEDSILMELYGTSDPGLNEEFDDDETLSEAYDLPPSSSKPKQGGQTLDSCGDGLPQDGPPDKHGNPTEGSGDRDDQTGQTRQSAASEALERLAAGMAEVSKELSEHGIQAGDMPGELEEIIERIKGSWQINWRKLVNGSAVLSGGGSTHEVKWRKSKLHRRLHTRPGLVLRPRGKKLICRDTSGSMSTRVLQEIEAEIRKLSRDNIVWVIDGDTQLQSSYRFTGKFPPCRGRGGTEFNWMFEWLTADPARAHSFDQVIVFTDGGGDVSPDWKNKVRVPVLWVITPGYYDETLTMPFGRCTFVKDVKEED